MRNPAGRGFTMIEVALVVGLISLLFTMLSPLFLTYFQTWQKGPRYSDLTQGIRETLDDISRKLREAQSITALSTDSTTPSISYIDKNGDTQTFSRFHDATLGDYAVGWNNVPLLYPVSNMTLTAYQRGTSGNVATTKLHEMGAIRIQLTVTDLEGDIGNVSAETLVRLAAFDDSATGYNLWPMFHRNQQRTGATTQTLLNPNQTGENLVEKWNFSVGNNVQNAPILQNGLVLFGSDDKKLYAIPTQAPGSATWTFTANSKVRSTPAAMNNRVYFGDNNDYIYCANMTNGASVWTFYSRDNSLDPSDKHQCDFSSHLAIANGRVYAASQGTNPKNYLYALNATNGNFIWAYRPANKQLKSSPAVVSDGSNTYLYIAWGDGVLRKLLDDDTPGNTSGSEWDFTLDNNKNIFSTPAVVYHPTLSKYVVYIGTTSNRLFAIRDDGGTATKLWEITTSQGGNKRLYSPTVTYDTSLSKFIIVVSRKNGRIYAIRDDGGSATELWHYRIKGDPAGEPVIANGVVYVGSSNGTLAALKLSNGNVLWSTDLGTDAFTSPAVGHNLLYIGSSNNKLYAFGKQ